MSGKIATFKDLDDIASLVEGTTSGYISGVISNNMCVSKRNFDIVSSKTIAAEGNGLKLKDDSDSLEYDSDRLILKDDVVITKTKCTIILSGESKEYHNTAFVKCTASVDGKLYWGETVDDMTNLIEITAGEEVEVISRTSVGTTAIYAYFVPTNPIYPTLGGSGNPYTSASAEITKAEDAGISITTYSNKTYNGSSQEVVECTDSHGTSEWYIGYTTDSSSTDVTWGEANTNLTLINAGTYYIWKKWIADNDHDNSNEGVKIDAEVTIKKKDVTVTAGSSRSVYDGNAYTYNRATLSGMVSGHTLNSYTCTGEITNVGSVDNIPSNAKIVDANLNDVTTNYNITYVNGIITISQRPITFTAVNQKKIYDGTALIADGTATVTLGSLVRGHSATFICSGSQRGVGTSVKILSDVQINSGTENVTSNYNITKKNGTLTVNQIPSILSYTPEDISTYCLNSTSALVKSQIVECVGAQGGGRFNYEVAAYDQEGSIISGFDISKYYLWTIEEGEGVIKGIVTYKRNPMDMILSDIVCIYLVDGQGMEAYVGLDNHRDVDEPWTHVANTSTDGENILKLAWSADGGEGIDEYTFGGELSDVPFDTFAISMPEGLSVGDYNIAITVKQADSNYAYDEVTRIFILSVLPDEHTGVYDGTLSINSSGLLSAGDDSRVITWGAVYTNWKYGGDKVYHPYSSHLRIECGNSAAAQFVSIDNMTYFNSEQVTTSVLTKESFRDTYLSSIPTYKISLLSYNGNVIKYINVNANKNESRLQSTRTEYGTPTITIGDTLTPGASSATVTCEVWNKDISTYLWSSGYESEREGAATAGSATWSIKNQTFTGSITTTISRFSKNNNTLSHSSMGTNVGTDRVILTAANTDAALEGVTTTGVDKTITLRNAKQHTLTSISVSYAAIAAGATSSTPTVTYNTSYKYLSGAAGGTTTNNKWTYSTLPSIGVEHTLTPSFSFSISTSYAGINIITGVVTWEAANTSSSARYCYVKCTGSLTSEGATSSASTANVAVKQNGINSGGSGGSDTTGNTLVTFHGSQGTRVKYSVTAGSKTVSVPGSVNISGNAFPIVIDATNTTSSQQFLTVTCENASGVTVSPSSGQLTLKANGFQNMLINVSRSSTVASASLNVYISTS